MYHGLERAGLRTVQRHRSWQHKNRPRTPDRCTTSRQDPKCRLCRDIPETVQHITAGCKMLADTAHLRVLILSCWHLVQEHVHGVWGGAGKDVGSKRISGASGDGSTWGCDPQTKRTALPKTTSEISMQRSRIPGAFKVQHTSLSAEDEWSISCIK